MSLAAPTSGRYVVPSIPVRRFSVDEYLRLIDQGFFSADEQFELLDGLITPKMSRNPPHDAALNRIRRRLEAVLSPGWMIRVQSALATSDSVPEPDIAVVRGDDRDYESHHPGPGDTALVVEVANTTLADDRGFKLSTYARAAIPTYWVVNLVDQQIEVYTDPSEQAGRADYRHRHDCRLNDSVPLPAGATSTPALAVRDLLRG